MVFVTATIMMSTQKTMMLGPLQFPVLFLLFDNHQGFSFYSRAAATTTVLTILCVGFLAAGVDLSPEVSTLSLCHSKYTVIISHGFFPGPPSLMALSLLGQFQQVLTGYYAYQETLHYLRLLKNKNA